MMLTHAIKKQYGWHITGWDIDNPPEIEHAFREEFLWGARTSINLPVYEIKPIFDQMIRKRGNLYWYRKWDVPYKPVQDRLRHTSGYEQYQAGQQRVPQDIGASRQGQ